MDQHWSTRNLAHTRIICNLLMGGLIMFLSKAKSSNTSFSRLGCTHAMYIFCLLLVVSFGLFCLLSLISPCLILLTIFLFTFILFVWYITIFVSMNKCYQLLRPSFWIEYVAEIWRDLWHYSWSILCPFSLCLVTTFDWWSPDKKY